MTHTSDPLHNDSQEPTQHPDDGPSDPTVDAAPASLVGIRVSPARALGVAVLTVFLTDALVAGGAALVAAMPEVPDPVRGSIFAGLIALGYGLGFLVAWGMTRRVTVPFAESYGLRGLGLVGLWLALVVALGARLLGGLWSVGLVRLGVKLPGMNLDPTAILPKDPLSIALAFIVFCGIAPFVEEFAFRGILFASLAEHTSLLWANLLSSALFAALHLNLFAGVAIFFASVGFAWAFARTRTLWASVFAHAMFNGFGLLAAYLLAGKVSM